MNKQEVKSCLTSDKTASLDQTEDAVDSRLAAFKKIIPHLRGSLWWGRDEEIQKRNTTFVVQEDGTGHPLLSLRKEEVSNRFDCIPMLFGTSGKNLSEHQKRCCIDVVGMQRQRPEHHTYFGSIIDPAQYSVETMLDAVSPKKGEHVFLEKDRHEIARGGERAILRPRQWFEFKAMIPNSDKPIVSEDEMRMIDDYCAIHQL